jgi:prepilin-type N-terminal cleavage/methylation domain-containing protein
MNQKGFSLIEVSLSIAIITVGLLTIISLFNNNIKSEIKSRNKLIAVYLANESIETVRQQRDNNWFRGVGWMTDIPIGDVIIAPTDISDVRKGWNVESVAVEDDKKIYQTSDDMYFQYNNAIPGTWKHRGFKRHLTINTGTAGCLGVGADCMEVVSYVSFGGAQLAEVTAYFYNGWF